VERREGKGSTRLIVKSGDAQVHAKGKCEEKRDGGGRDPHSGRRYQGGTGALEKPGDTTKKRKKILPIREPS